MKKILRLVTVVCAALLARWALRRWVEGPEPASADEAWAPARASGPEPEGEKSAPQPPRAIRVETAPPAQAPSSSNGRRSAGSARRQEWVRPSPSGEAPPTHPVKAKLGSRTYRVPGARGYDTSRPDRCYPSAEAAEADGFTMAKR